MSDGLGLGVTIVSALAGVGIVALGAWRHGRPAEPMTHPRLIPWVWVMLLGATLALVMLVHLANLLGVETGRGRGYGSAAAFHAASSPRSL